MAEESKGTVLLALGANTVVAVAKIVAGVLGGSAVMKAEAAHSVADTLNQVFMYLSLRLSSKKPDRQHQFGYGEKRFFWALIAAVGIFVAGAGFSLFEAYRAFFEPSADRGHLINYIVFGFAAVMEGVSWLRAFRQTRGEARASNRSMVRHIVMSPDPSAKTVASEDTVAVIGDLLGLAATGLQQATGQTFWDGVAALIIMAMLVFVAFALANDNMDLLIGEAIEPEKEEGIRRIIGSEPGIDEVSDVRTTRIGATQVLVAARVGLRRDLDGAEVEKLARQIDRKIRGEFPEVTLVFVDPSRRRDEWAELFAASCGAVSLADRSRPVAVPRPVSHGCGIALAL